MCVTLSTSKGPKLVESGCGRGGTQEGEPPLTRVPSPLRSTCRARWKFLYSSHFLFYQPTLKELKNIF